MEQSGKFCVLLDFQAEASFTCGGLAPMPAGMEVLGSEDLTAKEDSLRKGWFCSEEPHYRQINCNVCVV